jgi:hypothetical protein
MPIIPEVIHSILTAPDGELRGDCRPFLAGTARWRRRLRGTRHTPGCALHNHRKRIDVPAHLRTELLNSQGRRPGDLRGRVWRPALR